MPLRLSKSLFVNKMRLLSVSRTQFKPRTPSSKSSAEARLIPEGLRAHQQMELAEKHAIHGAVLEKRLYPGLGGRLAHTHQSQVPPNLNRLLVQ